MKFSVTEEDNVIIVYVEVPHYWPAGKIPKIRVQTPEVIRRLKEQGIKHGKCIEECDIKNWREHSRRGTWTFEKEKTRKIKKVLDKPKEKVILEEEKVVTPKKRVRSSSKKVSTEE